MEAKYTLRYVVNAVSATTHPYTPSKKGEEN